KLFCLDSLKGGVTWPSSVRFASSPAGDAAIDITFPMLNLPSPCYTWDQQVLEGIAVFNPAGAITYHGTFVYWTDGAAAKTQLNDLDVDAEGKLAYGYTTIPDKAALPTRSLVRDNSMPVYDVFLETSLSQSFTQGRLAVAPGQVIEAVNSVGETMFAFPSGKKF